jgi:hypothetical protein
MEMFSCEGAHQNMENYVRGEKKSFGNTAMVYHKN